VKYHEQIAQDTFREVEKVALMIDEKRMVKELLEFIQIPSPSRHEKNFAERVKKSLSALGIKCQEDATGKKIGGDCGNLYVSLPGDKRRPTLLFGAHLDTVESGGKITPIIRKGVMTSSGKTILGTDDKAAVAAILEMLRVLKTSGAPHGPIELVFTVSEESGLLGAKHFDCRKLKAKAGFIFDAHGPVGSIIVKAPAYDGIDATITGRATHAGASPEKGISAIQIAARAIAAMRLGRIDAHTTANIGIITGGTALNIVPEKCRLQGEARSHREAALARQVRHMLKCLHEAARRAGGDLEVEVERHFEAFRAPAGSLPVKMAKAAAKQLNLPFAMKASGGGADTAVFSAAGLPCITVACGYENPHGVNESIALEQLRLLGEYAVALATSL
jgi:tripeptide aminopeptidase